MRVLEKFSSSSWKLTIRTKLIVLVGLLLAGIVSFIQVYFPLRLEEQARRALMAKVQSIAAMTAFSVGPGLLFEDRGDVEEVFESALENKDLVYIEVHDGTGRIFAAFYREGEEETNGARLESGSGISQDGSIYRTVTPILINGREIGRLYLGLSLKELSHGDL